MLFFSKNGFVILSYMSPVSSTSIILVAVYFLTSFSVAGREKVREREIEGKEKVEKHNTHTLKNRRRSRIRTHTHTRVKCESICQWPWVNARTRFFLFKQYGTQQQLSIFYILDTSKFD